MLRAYPGVKFRRIEPGKPLPYADGEFDIACSNAVLEHVGGPDMRAAFIKEHLRVARSVFITIPNRWFPIEHHTKIPLLHYAPELFRKSIAGTRLRYWARPSNLEFLDRQLIFREWPIAAKPEVVFTGIPLGRLSSNLAIIVKR